MIGKIISAVFDFVRLTDITNAKSFELTSVDQRKPFSLDIYCSDDGKAAMVQYNGKTGYIALRLKSLQPACLPTLTSSLRAPSFTPHAELNKSEKDKNLQQLS
jgi:hypothetical protein